MPGGTRQPKLQGGFSVVEISEGMNKKESIDMTMPTTIDAAMTDAHAENMLPLRRSMSRPNSDWNEPNSNWNKPKMNLRPPMHLIHQG